ncbi:MAG TPA: HDIG domain-containing protein [Fimbriimonadaceae bacterium]|nr:HDIG domain-containing protein [Fimbriimonadaceae bacterium]HRJ33477.1 HDIG domain-containing protein [Fimbriimonadaceae bacterium]
MKDSFQTIASRWRLADVAQGGRVAVQGLKLLGAGALGAFLLLAHNSWPVPPLTLSGTVLITLFALVLTRFHLRHTPVTGTTPHQAEKMIWLVAFGSIGGIQLLTRGIGDHQLLGIGFLLTAPLVAQAMLASALLGPALSVFALTVVAFLLGVSGTLPVTVLAASWLAGAVGAHAVNPLKQRSDLLRAMSIQALALGLIAVCISAGAVGRDQISIVASSAGWAALAAIIATSIFWLGVAVLEKLFDIISDWSLLELCSPDHPLLRDLMLRAPGTYAHSVIVGNLAENAARAIGANPVICRAMAYFHDVGKMNRPSYFIENQVGPNIHDSMSPTVSAMTIAAHVRDGLDLAKQYKLPPIIRDGIAQHHGTTLIRYFFDRALAQSGEQGPDITIEQFFRYEGPKPQTREAAILHLADSVEAVSRSVDRGDTENLEIAVLRVIEERRADGQLDECDLTFRDLRAIHQSFMTSLSAIRHERIVYPDSDPYETPSHSSNLDLQLDRNSSEPLRTEAGASDTPRAV